VRVKRLAVPHGENGHRRGFRIALLLVEDVEVGLGNVAQHA
jgi:hypothetical protein